MTDLVERLWDDIASLRGEIEALKRERDEAKDEAATFVLEHLAKALSLKHWTIHDGAETWDGDVASTLYGILRDARVLDPETDRRVTGEEIEALKRERDEARNAIAWANNSLFGSHSFFLSIEHHLDSAIEKLKERATTAEAELAKGCPLCGYKRPSNEVSA